MKAASRDEDFLVPCAPPTHTMAKILYTLVKMRAELGGALHRARSREGLSLEAASRAAKISQGYLHKLETGRVENPSPRVLQRLSEVLDIPYRRLMELTDYLLPSDQHTGTSRSKEKPTMAIQAQTDAPTNRELVRLLQSVLDQVAELNQRQKELIEVLKR